MELNEVFFAKPRDKKHFCLTMQTKAQREYKRRIIWCIGKRDLWLFCEALQVVLSKSSGEKLFLVDILSIKWWLLCQPLVCSLHKDYIDIYYFTFKAMILHLNNIVDVKKGANIMKHVMKWSIFFHSCMWFAELSNAF